MLKGILTFFCQIIFLFSCIENSPYPGFSKAKHGIYYQLHKIGEEDNKASIGDFVTADIQYLTLKDSVFFKGRRKIQLSSPQYKGAIDECFMMLSKDESATFILPANNFFKITLQRSLPSFLDETSNFKIKLDILEIQTENEFLKEKEAFLNWIEDFGEYEKVILKQFLQEEQIPVKPTKSGLYYIRIKEGRGPIIAKGDTVTIHYHGRFLGGKNFDSSKKRNIPLQFVYGTEWQVIDGINEAIGMMKEGEKAVIILPSDIAFGSEGSSTGIIPPYTSIIYELEIIKVNYKNIIP